MILLACRTLSEENVHFHGLLPGPLLFTYVKATYLSGKGQLFYNSNTLRIAPKFPDHMKHIWSDFRSVPTLN